MAKILLTGPTGFIGSAIYHQFSQQGHEIIPVVRTPQTALANRVLASNPLQPFKITLPSRDIDIVIHTAALVHQMTAVAYDAYHRVNVEGIRNLLESLRDNKPYHFIFLSSIKVNGEETHDQPFAETDAPHPQDDYAQSKYAAEQLLIEWCQTHTVKYTIFRLPLVYGAGVGANFQRLIQLVQHKRFLPLGAVHNSRSMLFLGNFLSILHLSIEQLSAVANQTFLLADGDDISTPNLIRHIAAALQKTIALLPVPLFLLKLPFTILGKKAEYQRLTSSLAVNSKKVQLALHWTPPYTVATALQSMLPDSNK